MSNVLIFDKTTKAVLQYLLSVNTPDYEGKDGILVNPDMSAVKTVPLEYLKVSGSRVLEMSASEKAAVDASKPIPPPSIEDQIKDLHIRVSKLEGGK
jgi:hypothetical protein